MGVRASWVTQDGMYLVIDGLVRFRKCQFECLEFVVVVFVNFWTVDLWNVFIFATIRLW